MSGSEILLAGRAGGVNGSGCHPVLGGRRGSETAGGGASSGREGSCAGQCTARGGNTVGLVGWPLPLGSECGTIARHAVRGSGPDDARGAALAVPQRKGANGSGARDGMLPGTQRNGGSAGTMLSTAELERISTSQVMPAQ